MKKQFNRDRKPAVLNPVPTVLVLCEDSESSKVYLQDAARHFRAGPKIEVSHKDTCPRNSVRAAIKQRNKFDEIYCCIDRDSHEHFDEALRLASANGIGIIASYPCFEFWLLLHFQRTRKSYASNARGSAANAVREDLLEQPSMSNYDKGSTRGLFAKLDSNRTPFATTNAAWTRVEAENDVNPNPSTSMDVLLARFEQLGA
jgi:RloB-like protein